MRSQLNGVRFKTTKVKYIIVFPGRMVGVQFRKSYINDAFTSRIGELESGIGIIDGVYFTK